MKDDSHDVTYLTSYETARLIKFSAAALRKWRREGRGPPFIRVGRQIRYVASCVHAWAKAHSVTPGG
jgi:hypothetical protein